jgi:hypothetical protein
MFVFFLVTCSGQAFWDEIQFWRLVCELVNMEMLLAAVVSLVFGIFGGASWVYKCTGMQAPNAFEVRAAQHIRNCLFRSTVVDIVLLLSAYFLDLTSCSRPLT